MLLVDKKTTLLGSRLKKLRGKRNQEDIAKAVGLTRASYSHYENDRVEPDINTLQNLSKFFNVTTDYLLGLTNNPGSNGPVIVAGKEIELSIDELKIFEELKKHPILFHDLATDPEKKVKELIKLYKMKQMLLDEDDDEEPGDGFGEIED